jgi:hypothetical protein
VLTAETAGTAEKREGWRRPNGWSEYEREQGRRAQTRGRVKSARRETVSNEKGKKEARKGTHPGPPPPPPNPPPPPPWCPPCPPGPLWSERRYSALKLDKKKGRKKEKKRTRILPLLLRRQSSAEVLLHLRWILLRRCTVDQEEVYSSSSSSLMVSVRTKEKRAEGKKRNAPAVVAVVATDLLFNLVNESHRAATRERVSFFILSCWKRTHLVEVSRMRERVRKGDKSRCSPSIDVEVRARTAKIATSQTEAVKEGELRREEGGKEGRLGSQLERDGEKERESEAVGGGRSREGAGKGNVTGGREDIQQSRAKEPERGRKGKTKTMLLPLLLSRRLHR